MTRLYIVVRSTLTAGQKIAQACHALSAFAHRHAALYAEWFTTSNTIVILEVPSEQALTSLKWEAMGRELAYATFLEPDLVDFEPLTAIAFEPRSASMLRALPLVQ